MNSTGKKIIIGMSGGVDSSVAAALLKKRGFNVTGVFMKLFQSKKFRDSQKQAKRIAKALDIPFLVFDFSKEFKNKIIDYFLKEYNRGRTPNPCVRCNQEIKFGLFLKKAMKLRADYIATGHYVKKSKIPALKERGSLNSIERQSSKSKVIYKLLMSKDQKKDQSYFLWSLNQKQLEKTFFPIGNYTKKEVKALARKFGILKLMKRESEDICFIEGDIQQFLKKYLSFKPGSILDISGKKIGQHLGLPLYTIGQRKRIEIPAQKPYYVVKLDYKKNALIVSIREKDLYKKDVTIEKVNWISGKEPKPSLKIKAKIRYLHKPASVKIKEKMGKNKLKIGFSRAQRAITPGQSLVLYRGKELLGGGIIEN